jgi:sugar/nucleoside kinase (ribokinase family)
MSGGILIVGDANVDLILQGDVVPRFGQAEQLLDRADLVLGGSASIAACGLARLGVDTALAALVGNDDFGRLTLTALSDNGVAIASVEQHPSEPTGLSVILSHPGDRAILTLVGTLPLLRASHVRAAVELHSPAHVHFASYFLLPALAAELPELLRWLRERGIRSSLDTNWDPAEQWAGLDAVLPNLDFLLPNGEELSAIANALGITGDAESAARGLAELGPTVVVKAGAAGGWSATPAGQIVRAPGLSLDVIDTTGAGDSFDAGYLAACDRGIDDEATRLRWAAVAGSLSTRGRGGTASQPTIAELREQL